MASTEHPKDYGIGMLIAEYRRALRMESASAG